METRSFRILFFIPFLFAAYFSNAGSWNQNARLHTIFAYVEPGPDQLSFHFDRYMPKPQFNISTGDWSYYQGHYYSNKAPGTTVLGILPYSILYLLQRSSGVDVDNPYVAYANNYLINIAISVLPLSLAVVALAKLLLSLGSSPRKAATIALAFGLSSPMFPYSTQLWGHPTSAALLVISLWRLYSGDPKGGFWSGWYAGLAVCTDYFAVFAAIAITLLALARGRHSFVQLIIGSIPAIAILATYHSICFGSPIALPTDYTNPQFIDTDHALGIFGSISRYTLWQLTFGSLRGIFFTTPILISCLIAFGYWFANSAHRLLCVSSFFVALTVLLLNASFNGWHGGACVVARYQIVALPFWFLALRYAPTWLALLSIPIGIFSSFQMLMIAAVSPIAPEIQKAIVAPQSPLLEWIYPKFFSAQLAQFVYPTRLQFFHPNLWEFVKDSSWNIGNLFFLSGLYSLLPLLVAASLLLYFLYSSIPPNQTKRSIEPDNA